VKLCGKQVVDKFVHSVYTYARETYIGAVFFGTPDRVLNPELQPLSFGPATPRKYSDFYLFF